LPIDRRNCTCTEENYQCEIGFQRELGSVKCSPDKTARRYSRRPDVGECEGSSATYLVDAYRKVPGDSCVNGFFPARYPVACPPKENAAAIAASIFGDPPRSAARPWRFSELSPRVSYREDLAPLEAYDDSAGFFDYITAGLGMILLGGCAFHFLRRNVTDFLEERDIQIFGWPSVHSGYGRHVDAEMLGARDCTGSYAPPPSVTF